MNARAVLLTPWRAAHPSLRWLSLAIVGLCMAGAASAALWMHGPKRWPLVLLLYGLGAAYAWAFLMPTNFLLALDARRLRMPAIERAAVLTLCLAALATVLLAVLTIGPGLGAAQVAAIVALIVAAGFAFAMLPAYLSMFIGALPLLGDALRRMFPIPPPADPRFTVWCAAAAVVFGLGSVLSWRRLMQQEVHSLGLSGALVMQFRRNAGMGAWSVKGSDGDRLIRQRSRRFLPEADLRGVGPNAPVASIRVALGGWFLPQTWRSRVRRWLAVVPTFGGCMAAMLLIVASKPHVADWRTLLGQLAIALGGLACLAGSLGTLIVGPLMLHQRWSTPQRELALLALLPGLGTPRQARSALLRACLVKPLSVAAALLLIALIAAPALKLSLLALLAVTTMQLLCGVASVALTLDALGGRPLPGWGLGVVCSVLTTAVFTTSFTALLSDPLRQGGAWAVAPAAWAIFLGVSLGILAMLGWIALRGGRATFKQPHPFLAHG